jgi:hypothetical protein
VAGVVLAEVEAAGRYHDDDRKVTADSMRIVRAWRLRADEDPYVIPDRAPDWGAQA